MTDKKKKKAKKKAAKKTTKKKATPKKKKPKPRLFDPTRLVSPISGEEIMESVSRVDRDMLDAIRDRRMTLTRNDIRYLVDLFYQVQRYRTSTGNQERASNESSEPCSMVNYVYSQMVTIENEIYKILDAWTETDVASVWAKSQFGVGPVISAGLAAHIRIEKAPVVGHIWRFAGLDPTVKWIGREGAKKLVAEVLDGGKEVTDEIVATCAKRASVREETIRRFATPEPAEDGTPGEITAATLTKALSRCPWNARLKVLTWKTGQCFMKTHNSPKSYYGKLYRERKIKEIEGNESGKFAELAAQTLREKKFTDKKTIATYKSGKLPDGRIESRAERWAVKLFLAHYHEVAYKEHFKKDPPLPYPIAYLGHVHKIDPPGIDPREDDDDEAPGAVPV